MLSSQIASTGDIGHAPSVNIVELERLSSEIVPNEVNRFTKVNMPRQSFLPIFWFLYLQPLPCLNGSKTQMTETRTATSYVLPYPIIRNCHSMALTTRPVEPRRCRLRVLRPEPRRRLSRPQATHNPTIPG